MLRIRLKQILLFILARFSFVYCILCLTLAAVFQSRAFCIGSLVAISFCVSNIIQGKRRSLLMAITFLISVPLLATMFKTDSTKGRILIYRLSLKIIGDNYLEGVGLGNFELKYSDYQQEYFRTGHFTTKELLLADNTVYAFNDYLQFIAETGLRGMILVAFYLMFFSWAICGSIINYNSELQKVFIVNILVLSVAAVFTHVFYHDVFVTILILSWIAFFTLVVKQTFPAVNKLAIFAGLLLLIFQYGHLIFNYKAYKAAESAKQLFEAGFLKEAYFQHASLMPTLYDDVDFLLTHSDILVARNQFEEAAKTLHMVTTIKRNNAVYTKLGKIYLLLKNFQESEKFYQKAVYVVPNRFNTRYNLFKFYIHTQQYAKAQNTGMNILKLPVKIKSEKVDYIKRKVKALLENDVSKIPRNAL